MVESIFEILKDVGTMGNMCKNDAESFFDRVRAKLDTVCIGSVRLLESLCCLDLHRFAKPERPLTGSLPILFVLMLVVMLYNAFVFGYMPAAGIAWNSSASLSFHALIFLLLSSFAQAVNTDPGSAPSTPKWTEYGKPPPEATERKRGSNEARWCRKSEAYKPDRAHFCRVLKKGVLRMDHYCPWLGNTVGFYNQKFFFLFLLYTNAACAQLGISFLQLLVEYTLPALTTFCLVGAEGLTLLVSSLLVPFFLFHVFLIGRNTTTIEFCEKLRDRNQDGTDSEGPPPVSYDLGLYANFRAVLGANPLTWLLPVGGPPGDGIKFPINKEYQEFLRRPTSNPNASAEEEQPAETKHDRPQEHSIYTPRSMAEELAAQSQPLISDSDACADPEATHPAACGTPSKSDEQAWMKGEDTEKGRTEEQEEEDGAYEEEEGSDAAPSVSAPSEGDKDGFLVWRDSAEFIEDLTIGCQFIAEKTEDCGRGSLLLLVTSCLPGALGRKAARRLTDVRGRGAEWKRSSSPASSSGGKRNSSRGSAGARVFPKRTKKSAVRVVPVRSGSGRSSHEDEGDSCSSAFLSE